MPNLRNFSGCSTGYCTSSCSSFFTFSKPPMSSHETLGTSTTVSRKAEGVDLPIANCASPKTIKLVAGRNQSASQNHPYCSLTRKFSMVTASESSTSASIWSSSKSIRSIFSRICCRAASEQRAAKSAPTWPWLSAATCTERHQVNKSHLSHYPTEMLSNLLFNAPVPSQRRRPASCSWCECAKFPDDPWHPEFRCPLRGRTDQSDAEQDRSSSVGWLLPWRSRANAVSDRPSASTVVTRCGVPLLHASI